MGPHVSPARELSVKLIPLVAWLSTLACSSSETTARKICVMSSDCQAGLVCRFGNCTVECKDVRDCMKGEECFPTDENQGVCRERMRCARSGACGPGEVCGFDGVCRESCGSDIDCKPGRQICVQGACFVRDNSFADGGPSSEAASTPDTAAPDAAADGAALVDAPVGVDALPAAGPDAPLSRDDGPSLDAPVRDAQVSSAPDTAAAPDLAADAGVSGDGGTSVSGNIVGATWNLAGSPYILTGNLTVVALTIEPGVRVAAAGDYSLEVTGQLMALGTRAAPIVFTTTVENQGGWGGIFFNSAGASGLGDCVVANATNSGIRVRESSLNVQRCWIHDNSAGQGGGIAISGNSSRVTIRNSVIERNVADNGFEAGGGIFVRDGAVLDVRNSVLADNRTVYANARGGGLFACGGQTTLLNVAMVDNGHATYGNGSGGVAINTGGLTNCTTADVKIRSSVLFGNVPFQGTGQGLDIQYSDVEGGNVGTGNIQQNPTFADGQYHLLMGFSPCIDTGDPEPGQNDLCFPPSMGMGRNDMGPYGGPGACDW